MSFDDLAAKGYLAELLPIVPPGARISSYSRDPEGLAEKAGKVPGKLVSDGWVGFAAWTKFSASAPNLPIWTSWGASVGVQTRRLPAIDIDVDNALLAARIGAAADGLLGPTAAREGRDGRSLRVYRAVEGFSPAKRTVSWFDGPAKQAVELLGSGQQFVAEGIHPVTKRPYRWSEPLAARAALPAVDEARWNELAEMIAFVVEMAGYEVLVASGRGQEDGADQDSLRAPSVAALAAAMNAAPNDVPYDEWIKVGVAIKAASGGSNEGRDVWMRWSLKWPGNTESAALEKWASFVPPFSTGWPWLSSWAQTKNPKEFNAGAFDFDEAQEPEPVSRDELFRRYAWISGLERAGDLTSRELLTRTQFNVRNNSLGDPSSTTKSAWAIWLREHKRLAQLDSVTYRPGQGLIVVEPWGRCLNTWTPSQAPIAESATNAEVEPWTELIEYMYPAEAETIFSWLAWVLQNQDKKPNWHLVMGSTEHGLGKDLSLRPIMRAIGEQNSRAVTPDQVLGPYTDWLRDKKLIVVEEMQTYGKRELENRLKPYLATPPDMTQISQKYMPLYEVPNICALIFLTNHENALPLTKQDRRYFVAWSDYKPRSPNYYEGIVEWQDNGGAAKVARWLLNRDVEAFGARNIAPMSEAKKMMQEQTLSPLEVWIENGVKHGDAPFNVDLVDLADLCKRVPREADWKSATPDRLGVLLRRAGAVALRRVDLATVLPTTGAARANLYVLRNASRYAALDAGALAVEFMRQRAAAEQEFEQ